MHHGDLFDVLPTLEADSIDACVTDPPYEFAFMGKKWDGTGVAFNVETWRAVLRVLKPGAHLVAFGGPRTFHRMTCAIEDAGFEIRDCLSWLFGSGFPKSLDVSKAIDAIAQGTNQKHRPRRETVYADKFYEVAGSEDRTAYNHYKSSRGSVTAPATDEAKKWIGWGTALKPGHEPVILAQKPYTDRQLLAILVPTIRGLIWSLLSVRDAGGSSSSNHHGSSDAGSGIVPGNVKGSNGSSGQMDTPALRTLTVAGFWNTAWLLSGYWDGLSEHASTFTTETASSLTTDLRILKSSLSRTMQAITGADQTQTDGGESNAWLVASISRSVLVKCERLARTTVGEIAIDWRATEGSAPAGGDFSTAWEPIVLARKPLVGTVAANVAKHGTGALNVDACRIETLDGLNGGAYSDNRDVSTNQVYGTYRRLKPSDYVAPEGRWPPNVLLDEEAAAQLDAQTGELHAPGNKGTDQTGMGGIWQAGSGGPAGYSGFTDAGGASRFYYVPKPSREERDYGCEHITVKTAGEATDRTDGTAGLNSPRAGAGRTGGSRNGHPTVKPVEVMRWLVKLVTPLEGIVLDPFAGSGTTGMACRYEQRRFIGIEREADYCAIAEARIQAVAPLFGDHP